MLHRNAPVGEFFFDNFMHFFSNSCLFGISTCQPSKSASYKIWICYFHKQPIASMGKRGTVATEGYLGAVLP